MAGVQILQRIADGVLEDLQPAIDKYHIDSDYGRAISLALEKTLFPWQEESKTPSAYGTLATLQGLAIYLANIQGHLTALVPASQALWDEEFISSTNKAVKGIARCDAWVKHQITVRAPQTLVVPSKSAWRKGGDGVMEKDSVSPYHRP